jgi:transcription elongation factor SPT4
MHGLLHRAEPDGTSLPGPNPSPFTQLTQSPTTQKFRDIGCPNCEDVLHLAGSQEQIESCTSQVFEGLITLADPARSWVAKWQRLDGYVKGVYATKVSGTLPDEVRQMLEDEGRVYIP